MARLNAQADALVQIKRKEIGGGSPFNAGSKAIDEVVKDLTVIHHLIEDEVGKLQIHLAKIFLEPLAAAEYKVKGRTDWEVK